jgi:type 1 glutamine amidotransferase
VLVFSKTVGYRHASITNGIAAIRELGSQHGFAVEATEDSSAFTATNLARFQTVVFLSVIGDVLNSEQEAAVENYLQGGGGLVAIHAAIFGSLAFEGNWAWYGNVIGCAFTNHSAIVPATVKIQDATHPSTAGLPVEWRRTDEWYNYTGTPRGTANVLATVDESTYRGGTLGSDHPISWWRPVGKGRMWFTAMGHTENSFSEPHFRQHLLGAIQAVARRTSMNSAARSK